MQQPCGGSRRDSVRYQKGMEMPETQGKKLERCQRCGAGHQSANCINNVDYWRDALAALCLIIDYTPDDVIVADPSFKTLMESAEKSESVKLAASMWERNLMLGFREVQRYERKRLADKLRAQARSLSAIGDSAGEGDAMRHADWIEEAEEADDGPADFFQMFRARALVDFITDFERLSISAGTNIVVLNPLPTEEDPRAFVIEVAIPDETSEGGFRFDTAELKVSEVERLTARSL